MARYVVSNFTCFVSGEKSVIRLAFQEKRIDEASWVVAFMNSTAKLLIRRLVFNISSSEWTRRSRRLALRL